MKVNQIAILDRFDVFGEKLAGRIRQMLPGCQVYTALNIEQLKAQTRDIDVLICWPFIDDDVESFCRNAPSLKWVHAFTAGVDGIVQSGLRDMDIQITATKGIHGPPISDHVIAFIFAFLRSLPALLDYQREKVWYRSHEHPEAPNLASEESFNKTVGVIGLGSIGTCIAQKCSALGMRVLGIKRTPVESPWVESCFGPDQLEQVLAVSDFVVIAAPLTGETAGMFGQEQLAKMKPSAYLINISRGGIVDDAALIAALRERSDCRRGAGYGRA